MKKIALALLLSGAALLEAAPAHAGAPDDAQTAAMCARGGCQRDVHVVLRQDDGSVFDRRFDVLPPIVQGELVAIVAGQTVYLEADIVDGRLANIVAVEKVSDPARTITASFEQHGAKGMLLHIHNPFKQALRFSMGIMPLSQDKLFKTSSCPVLAGLELYEHWPQAIFQVVLSAGRVPQGAAEMACF